MTTTTFTIHDELSLTILLVIAKLWYFLQNVIN